GSFYLFCIRERPPHDTPPLSLHDALPISRRQGRPVRPRRRERRKGGRRHWRRVRAGRRHLGRGGRRRFRQGARGARTGKDLRQLDWKSTRLNSSHVKISYAVFCLKKKKQE